MRQTFEDGVERVNGYNAKYWFSLSRSGNAWAIDEVQLRKSESLDWSEELIRNKSKFGEVERNPIRGIITGALMHGALLEALQINSTGNRLWCDQDDFKIVRDEAVVLGGQPARQITAEWTSRGVTRQPDGSFVWNAKTSSGDFWCLSEYNLFPVKSEIRLARATIKRELKWETDSKKRFPRILSETYDWQAVPPNEAPPKHKDWMFDPEFPATFAAREFRMSAYGLPEPPGVRWSQGGRWVLWTLAGALLIAVAIWLRRRRKQSKG